MIFNTYYSEKEITRLMTRIPNFRPRGHGSYVFDRFEYSAEDCDCSLCLHYHKKTGCTELNCPYLTERITAGAVPIGEVLLEVFSEVDHFDFQIRLLQYIPSAVSRETSHRSEHTVFVSSGLRHDGAHRSEGHDRQRQ